MRQDLYTGCNDQGVPEKDFTEMFCNRCRNTSCVRAGWATSTWDRRISTQVDRLLLNPNIISQEGTKWEEIPNFESLEITGEVEVWDFPKQEAVVQAVAPTPKSFQTEPVAIEPPVVSKPIAPALNTPVQSQIMIGGAEPPPNPTISKTPVDEWAVPPKKLKVGGTFKMGDS